MNERIKHLAEQTSYIWHTSGDPQIYEFTPEKLEKFSELIVKEREWVWLTKEEVDSWELPDCPTVFEFVQFIEAKVKEKNT